jgi:lysophospholipase L1-like esterase
MTTTSRLALGLTGLLLLTGACSGTDATTEKPAATAGNSGLSTVLLLGDSIAAGQAVALTEAFAASDVRFQSVAAEGGGNVVGPFADKNWAKLPGQIDAARPTVVLYQITTYDWGSAAEQQAAYRRLLSTVSGAGAKLVFVTAPPIRPDDFYRPHLADLKRTTASARAVAEGSAGGATVLDAEAVWGREYQRDRDGTPDRSSDGVHTCPQGAARFANWLLGELAGMFGGFAPAEPAEWANTGWSADKRFIGC